MGPHMLCQLPLTAWHGRPPPDPARDRPWASPSPPPDGGDAQKQAGTGPPSESRGAHVCMPVCAPSGFIPIPVPDVTFLLLTFVLGFFPHCPERCWRVGWARPSARGARCGRGDVCSMAHAPSPCRRPSSRPLRTNVGIRGASVRGRLLAPQPPRVRLAVWGRLVPIRLSVGRGTVGLRGARVRSCGSVSPSKARAGSSFLSPGGDAQDRGPLPSARHVPSVPCCPAPQLWRRFLSVAWYL